MSTPETHFRSLGSSNSDLDDRTRNELERQGFTLAYGGPDLIWWCTASWHPCDATFYDGFEQRCGECDEPAIRVWYAHGRGWDRVNVDPAWLAAAAHRSDDVAEAVAGVRPNRTPPRPSNVEQRRYPLGLSWDGDTLAGIPRETGMFRLPDRDLVVKILSDDLLPLRERRFDLVWWVSLFALGWLVGWLADRLVRRFA